MPSDKKSSSFYVHFHRATKLKVSRNFTYFWLLICDGLHCFFICSSLRTQFTHIHQHCKFDRIILAYIKLIESNETQTKQPNELGRLNSWLTFKANSFDQLDCLRRLYLYGAVLLAITNNAVHIGIPTACRKWQDVHLK